MPPKFLSNIFAGASVLACSLALAQAPSPPPAPPADPSPAAATSDADSVAAGVQAFYDQAKDLTASFFQTYVNKVYQRTDRSKGRVVFKKPGMMRWDYDLPNGKVMTSNGKKVLVFEPGEDGDKGQVIEQDLGAAQLPQAMSFLLGTGKLQEDFTFRLLDAAREGYPTGDVLELRPKVATPHFERLLFYVERTKALRGLVRRLLIIDASGNRNRFDFSAIKFNGNVGVPLFDFKPPPGTRRVAM
jgi:outer membrane lipoprotein carrier protein